MEKAIHPSRPLTPLRSAGFSPTVCLVSCQVLAGMRPARPGILEFLENCGFARRDAKNAEKFSAFFASLRELRRQFVRRPVRVAQVLVGGLVVRELLGLAVPFEVRLRLVRDVADKGGA